jgi:hypothetical protein
VTEAYPPLAALESSVAFEAMGENAGNVTIGRGTLDGRAIHVALVQNRAASGSIGSVEAKKLGALFQVAAREKSPVILFLDSAGAKVSEGLRALGAFRQVFRDALQAALAGAPIAAVLGKNCYGGSSMLAHVARDRLFGPNTQLAMSGPSILAASAGMNVFDEMFRAMAEASISAAARATASPRNHAWADGLDVAAWLREALQPIADPRTEFHQRHDALGARLGKERVAGAAETIQRRDLERLYLPGYEAREASGFIEGAGTSAEGEERFIGIVGKTPLGTERAWRFAEAAWKLLEKPPARLRVFLDCAAHAARLDDERIVLSEYVVGMSAPLGLLAAGGTHVELTVLGEAGGGVYVALASPAKHVSAVHGAQIRVLPGTALTAILGEVKEEATSPAEYKAAGVAEEELKLGIVQAK